MLCATNLLVFSNTVWYVSKAPFTLLRINFLSVPQVVRIGLPSTLLHIIRTKTGAVLRTTLIPLGTGRPMVIRTT